MAIGGYVFGVGVVVCLAGELILRQLDAGMDAIVEKRMDAAVEKWMEAAVKKLTDAAIEWIKEDELRDNFFLHYYWNGN